MGGTPVDIHMVLVPISGSMINNRTKHLTFAGIALVTAIAQWAPGGASTALAAPSRQASVTTAGAAAVTTALDSPWLEARGSLAAAAASASAPAAPAQAAQSAPVSAPAAPVAVAAPAPVAAAATRQVRALPRKQLTLGASRAPAPAAAPVSLAAAAPVANVAAAPPGPWSEVDPGITSDWLFGVACLAGTAKPCFAAGTGLTALGTSTGGKVYRSDSGGQNWTLSTSTAAGHPLTAIACSPGATSNTCLAVGGAGTVVRTTDAGATWTTATSVGTVNLYGVSCVSDTICWVAGAGGVVEQTMNAGASWIAVNTGTTADLVSIDCFIAACMTVGSGGTALVILGADVIFPSGGNISFTIPVTSSYLDAVSCSFGDKGFIPYCVTASDGTSPVLEVPMAAIATVVKPATPLSSTMLGIGCGTALHCSAVGPGGQVMSTTDGVNWTTEASGTSKELDAVRCGLHGSFCLAVGQNGTILKK